MGLLLFLGAIGVFVGTFFVLNSSGFLPAMIFMLVGMTIIGGIRVVVAERWANAVEDHLASAADATRRLTTNVEASRELDHRERELLNREAELRRRELDRREAELAAREEELRRRQQPDAQ